MAVQTTRILIIDDDPLVLNGLRRMLSGRPVQVADSGAAALERCRAETFDIILCDVMMSDYSGFELWSELKNLGLGLEQRVIFISGGVFSPTLAQAIEGLPNSMLRKPFDRPTLEARIAETLQRVRETA